MKRWLRRLTLWGCIGHATGMLVVLLGLRLIGEAWWVTALGLYVPHIALGLPFVPLLPLSAWLGPRWLLGLQAGVMWLWLVPLMGFGVPSLTGADRADGDGRGLRVLTYNIDGGRAGVPALVRELQQHAPDVILLQELGGWDDTLAEALGARYPHVHRELQFVLASRFPIRSKKGPWWVPHGDGKRTTRTCRYELDTPLGTVAFYNMHPLSPREAFYVMRAQGLRDQLYSGAWFGPIAHPAAADNYAVRAMQVREAMAAARAESLPVVIAGDTNLPGPSPLRAEHFDGFTDAFDAAGLGFGYTYPKVFPWMRIDRVLVGGGLAVASVQTGCGAASDHLCVIAELTRTQ